MTAAWHGGCLPPVHEGFHTSEHNQGGTMHIREMIDTHPKKTMMDVDALVACIQACLDCLQSCTACADACLAEESVQALTRCIRLNLDCSDVCGLLARMLSRQTEPELGLLRGQVEACALACRLCAGECEKHASMHAHCAACADACRRCEQACDRLLGVKIARAA